MNDGGEWRATVGDLREFIDNTGGTAGPSPDATELVVIDLDGDVRPVVMLQRNPWTGRIALQVGRRLPR